MSEICANLLKIAIIKFMQIIFMRFQHESTVTENASSGAVNLNRRQSAPFERQRLLRPWQGLRFLFRRGEEG